MENIGFNNRSGNNRGGNERYVLDIIETSNGGYPLMMLKRNSAKDLTQKWSFTNDERLCCKLPNFYVEAKNSMLFLNCQQQQQTSKISIKNSIRFKMQRQRPGSGILMVNCLHVGPTLVFFFSQIFDSKLVCFWVDFESN